MATDRNRDSRHRAVTGLVLLLAASSVAAEPGRATGTAGACGSEQSSAAMQVQCLRRQLRDHSHLLIQRAGEVEVRLLDEAGLPATRPPDSPADRRNATGLPHERAWAIADAALVDDAAGWRAAIAGLSDPAGAVREEAIESLADIDAIAAAYYAVPFLNDPDRPVALAAARLQSLANASAATLAAWPHWDFATRLAAVDAFADIDNSARRTVLTFAQSDADPRVAVAARQYLDEDRKGRPTMRVGHINLAASFNGTGEHFVALIETLDRHGVEQHIVLQNQSLGRRVALGEKVTLGPTTRSPVVAYCLMPQVDVVHIHDEDSAQAGLLLTLTRSIPFVFTRRKDGRPARHALNRSIYSRSAAVVCTRDSIATAVSRSNPGTVADVIADIARRGNDDDFERQCNQVAAQHIRLYRRTTDTLGVPSILL